MVQLTDLPSSYVSQSSSTPPLPSWSTKRDFTTNKPPSVLHLPVVVDTTFTVPKLLTEKLRKSAEGRIRYVLRSA